MQVDEIVGRDRTPNIFDRESMPYTQATIFELLRFQSPLPILVPHMTLEDTSIGSHRIPAGTIVMPLVASVHHDEKFWGDPLVFRPDRFLDDDGKLLPSDHPNRKHLMQFGAGVRECVGEIFALRRLFIFIASIAQAFDLKPGDVITSCANTDYIENFMLSQKPFTARLMARNA